MTMMLCSASSNVNCTMPPFLQFLNHYAQGWQSPWFVVALMDTFGKLYMIWQDLLQIILSKLHLQELFRAGVPSEFLEFFSSSCLSEHLWQVYSHTKWSWWCSWSSNTRIHRWVAEYSQFEDVMGWVRNWWWHFSMYKILLRVWIIFWLQICSPLPMTFHEATFTKS